MTSVTARRARVFALLGNPNTGKTTLFNRLCGVRAKTANFPGSTIEARIGRFDVADTPREIVDLPGIYALELDRPESRTCRAYLRGEVDFGERPEAMVIVVDASNLKRNLMLAATALRLDLPTVIALNMVDVAERRGLRIDAEHLASHLGCPVIPISARSGAGVPALLEALDDARPAELTALPEIDDVETTSTWARDLAAASGIQSHGSDEKHHARQDRLDAIFTHRVLGLLIFIAVMTGLFYAIFTLASVPMDLIEIFFGHVATVVSRIVPPGPIHDLLVNGVISGIAGTLVFLPQICLLFFLISLLEDTGYLTRAAFVMDRLLRRFGLPGQSFVPLLSAHACAIPAIMSARMIHDPRQRIATVLVAPFMSCSARLPVYVLLIGILFEGSAALGGLAFAGCYLLGAAAALITALVARHSILRGPAPPMVSELPSYKLPSLRTALLTTYDRGMLFLRKAGTIILAICIVLWWLSAYPAPKSAPPAAETLRAEAALVEGDAADALLADAESIESRHAMASSFAGRLGRSVEPVFAPIGLDWQLSVSVLTSFAAREVFVSTLAVLMAGTDDVESPTVTERITSAKRDDGTPVFTARTAASLLVFYVLAMQCLPTLPVTAREAGHWGWAILQLVYMSLLAYGLAWGTYAGLGAMGVS